MQAEITPDLACGLCTRGGSDQKNVYDAELVGVLMQVLATIEADAANAVFIEETIRMGTLV